MEPIEVARRLVRLGDTEDALKAYELVLRAQKHVSADEKLEAAIFVLQFQGEYRYAYLAFLELYKEKQYAQDVMAIMTEAFYEPNQKLLRSHYENNCKYLKRYPYLFQKDFIPFDELPIRFYPFDDNHYIPYYVENGCFGDATDYSEPVITRNFFHDLENPILAKDVYSQYELEYLNDNVRPSEYVSKENHIYLHYSSWEEFCSYLQVLNFRKLLADQKLVFLISDEISQYPIDFKERFGLDYCKYPLRPIGIREFHRLIWHMQLSYHNGGDFFNEIMDAHPNLLSSSSIFHDSMEETLADLRCTLDDARSWAEVKEVFSNGEWENFDMIRELYFMRDRTDKDILVTAFCCCKRFVKRLDLNSRIAPVIFYQPHFGFIHTNMPVKHEAFGYMLLKTGHKRAYPLHDELCLLLTTSGSTGSPKFVRQSYENVLSNAAAIVQYLELDETERPITTLPMNYTYGLSIINSHSWCGPRCSHRVYYGL